MVVAFRKIYNNNQKDDIKNALEELRNSDEFSKYFLVNVQAKREELSEIYRRGIWTETGRSLCLVRTGKPPISVRWVVVNKGGAKNPVIRARLVARHIAAKYGRKTDLKELFAAMPPFEMIQFLLMLAVQGSSSRAGTLVGTVPRDGTNLQ